MASYCRDRLPAEACGAVLGRRAASDGAGAGAEEIWRVTAWRPLGNDAPDPCRFFRLRPEEWVPLAAAHGVFRPDGVTLLGLFHSHPDTPARMSRSDEAGWPDGETLTSWIFSFARPAENGLYTLRAYRRTADGRFRRIALHKTAT